LTVSEEKAKYVGVSKKRHHQCKQIVLVLILLFRFIINDDNSISEEITHRIEKGNRAFYAYKGLIRLAVTIACETWTLYGT